MCHNIQTIKKGFSDVSYLDELETLFLSYLQSSSLSLKNKRCEFLNSKLDELEEKLLHMVKSNQSFENNMLQEESFE